MLPNNLIIITYKLALPFIIVIIYVGFSTSNFNYFTVICLWNRPKQGMYKWTMQSLHIKTCIFLLDFLLSLPYFHQCNAHNALDLLWWVVWRSLYFPPNTTLFLIIPFNISKFASLTMLHLALNAALFTDTLAEVVRSGLTYDFPKTWLWLFLLASMNLRLFDPYLSGLIHPRVTHFWNS